jgi:hypothetical protein
MSQRQGAGQPDPRHLIHIGYAKAGSSFLQAWFTSHPEIAYVEGGIAGYATVWEVARQAAEPRHRIRYRVTSAEALARPTRYAGQVGYRGRPPPSPPEAETTVCQELVALFPDAEVLLVTRGFRSAYLSRYSQSVRGGGTDEFDPTGQGLPPEVWGRSWDYTHLIRVYGEAFGERLHVLPYELLRDDPAGFVATLQARLGLTEPGPLPGRVNPSLSAAELRWYPRLSRLVVSLPVRGRVRRRLLDAWANRTRHNRYAPLIRLLQRIRPAPPIVFDEMPAALLERFRGCAEPLRDDPLYAPYQSEYLL